MGRSDGVFCVSGSSPLARGLPQLLMEQFDLDRIIPARAGFTSSFWTFRSVLPDHPRSRGVYADVCVKGGQI